MALVHTPLAELGQNCPDFTLPGTDGRTYSRRDFSGSSALLVMFICNHCPYVQAIEDRLIALGHHFAASPVRIIAISSNDADRYPADSFDKMKERATEKRYPFPYLYDESQDVAEAFGAVCTPDFFLYDSEMKLAYRGRLDDSWKDASLVQHEELKAAITALVQGQRPSLEQKPSMGCSMKWKAGKGAGV